MARLLIKPLMNARRLIHHSLLVVAVANCQQWSGQYGAHFRSQSSLDFDVSLCHAVRNIQRAGQPIVSREIYRHDSVYPRWQRFLTNYSDVIPDWRGLAGAMWVRRTL